MKTKEPKYSKTFLQNWERTRKSGRLMYALRQGVIAGFTLHILFRLYRGMILGEPVPPFFSSEYFIGLAIFIAINMALWGTLSWNLNNIKYRRMKKMGEGKI